jgi:hypothetical protein
VLNGSLSVVHAPLLVYWQEAGRYHRGRGTLVELYFSMLAMGVCRLVSLRVLCLLVYVCNLQLVQAILVAGHQMVARWVGATLNESTCKSR